MAGDAKERIIEHAVELFYSRGFVKASIRDLANSLGITQASIYNHFKNKDEILFTIMDRLGDELTVMLKKIEAQSDDSPVESLWKMIHSHLCLLKKKKREFRIFVDELNQLPDNLETYCSAKHRTIFELYRNMVDEIHHQGMANPVDRTVAAFSILGVIVWFYRWINVEGPMAIDEAADEILRMIFFGLLKPGVGCRYSSGPDGKNGIVSTKARPDNPMPD